MVSRGARSGDFYPVDDYEQIVQRLFARYGGFRPRALAPRLLGRPGRARGRSGDRFHVIYVDGSHTYQAVCADLANYAPKVAPGGWLVMDDASYDLPGTAFWKGYESVARACQRLPGLGFRNVLNVGHNRLFEKG